MGMVMMTAVVIAVGGEGSVSNWIRALNDNGRHGSGGDDGRYPGVGVGGGGGGAVVKVTTTTTTKTSTGGGGDASADAAVDAPSPPRPSR